MSDRLLLLTSKSGNEFREIVAQADLLAEAGNRVSLLLFGDAVFEAMVQRTDTDVSRLADHAEVFACLEDTRIRGLEQRLLRSIKAIDYPTVVDLIMTENDKVVSCV